MKRPIPDPLLAAPLKALAERDGDIAKALVACGLPPKRSNGKGFPALVSIIVSQQVSVASVRAIMGRLKDELGELTPEAILAMEERQHRGVGLSRQKSLYLTSLARDLDEGRLSFTKLARLEDEAAIEHLTQAKGLGRWSAEIYLLFSLKRPDVMPAGDLALQVAAQRLKNLPARPSPKELYALSEAWRPHRSAAARFLWHYYRHSGVEVE